MHKVLQPASAMGGQCPVCCDPYTDVKRVRVECAYCHYNACATCYKQYITESVQDAHCMSCRHLWTRDFLTTYFASAWLNGDYKKHREKILVEREKQLLPESQELVANYRQAKALREGLPSKNAELTELRRKTVQLKRQIETDKFRAERLERNGYRADAFLARNAAAKRQKAAFITPCPVDGCRGFMNAESMTCGVCAVAACGKCGVILSDDHECVKETVESFAMIKKDTRPCPKCAIPTFKISGCSQMWCTGCQTPWDWTTGEIVQGVIHNPHYFQFLRERSATGEIPRNPGDVQCDHRVFPGGYELYHKSRRVMVELFGASPSDAVQESEEYTAMVAKNNDLANILRKLTHIGEVEIERLRRRFNTRDDNSDLRLKYLTQEIDEGTFKVQLQRREKTKQKHVAVRDVYQMICDTGRETFWAYIDDTRTLDSTLEELHALRDYANEHLKKIRTQYQMTVSII